jgi:hypothetical protein
MEGARREVRKRRIFIMTTHFAKVPSRAAADPRLRAADFRVLVAVCSHANGDGGPTRVLPVLRLKLALRETTCLAR